MIKMLELLNVKVREYIADISIRIKILIGFVIVSVIAVLCVGIFLYKISSSIILAQDEAYTRSLLNHITDRVEKLKDEVFRVSIPLVTNPIVTKDFSTQDDTSLVIAKKKSIQNELSSVLFIKRDIASIYICTQTGIIISSGALSSLDESGYQDYEVFKKAAENDLEPSWIGVHENEFILDNSRNVLTYVRPIFSNNFVAFGALIINVSDTVLDRICTNEIASGILILNLNGDIIYSNLPDTEFSLNATDIQMKVLTRNEDDGKFKVDYDNNQYNVQYTKPIEDDWIFVAITPYNYFIQNSVIVKKNMIIILFIAIVISLALSYATSSLIVVPIQKVIKLMKRVQEGELDLGTIRKNRSETGQLAENFETMMKEIRLLMHQVDDENKKKREAELNTLQAQITPHFLYNTLNSIKCLAIIQKQKNIEEMTADLIELLRLSISCNEIFIPISYEIEMLKKYLSIQDFMNGNKYKVEFEIGEEVIEYLTLKMTLQPFVENSILHSNIQKSKNGIIVIRAYKRSETICFEIEDNGIGMSPEQVQGVMNEKSQSDKKYSGIGIKNVDERIKMHFGNDFGVSYKSTPGKYTIASIVIPAFVDREKSKYEKSNNS